MVGFRVRRIGPRTVRIDGQFAILRIDSRPGRRRCRGTVFVGVAEGSQSAVYIVGIETVIRQHITADTGPAFGRVDRGIVNRRRNVIGHIDREILADRQSAQTVNRVQVEVRIAQRGRARHAFQSKGKLFDIFAVRVLMVDRVLQGERIGPVGIQANRKHVATAGGSRQGIRVRIIGVSHRLPMAGQAGRTGERIVEVTILQARRRTGRGAVRTEIELDQIAAAEAQISASRQRARIRAGPVGQVVFVDRADIRRADRSSINFRLRHIVDHGHLEAMGYRDIPGGNRVAVPIGDGQVAGHRAFDTELKLYRVLIQCISMVDTTN